MLKCSRFNYLWQFKCLKDSLSVGSWAGLLMAVSRLGDYLSIIHLSIWIIYEFEFQLSLLFSNYSLIFSSLPLHSISLFSVFLLKRNSLQEFNKRFLTVKRKGGRNRVCCSEKGTDNLWCSKIVFICDCGADGYTIRVTKKFVVAAMWTCFSAHRVLYLKWNLNQQRK